MGEKGRDFTGNGRVDSVAVEKKWMQIFVLGVDLGPGN